MNWPIFNAVFRLTIRQVLTVKRVIILAILVAIPILGAITFLFFDFADESVGFILRTALFPAVMPIVALIVASPAFSDEIEDRTLPIIVLVPVPRWQIVLPKVAAVMIVATLPVSIAAIVAAGVATSTDPVASILSAAVGSAFGCICYAALFSFLGTITGRAVIIGLLYVAAWEIVLIGILPTLGYLSIRQFAVAVAAQIDPAVLPLTDGGAPDMSGLPAIAYALIAGFVVIFGCTSASVWRLRKMDVN